MIKRVSFRGFFTCDVDVFVENDDDEIADKAEELFENPVQRKNLRFVIDDISNVEVIP